jgi:hypothetical protein
VNFAGDASKTGRAVINCVHGRHVRKQSLAVVSAERH